MHVTSNQKTRYLANLNEENLKKERKENVGAQQTVKTNSGKTNSESENKIVGY